MAHRVVWSPRGLADVEAIATYIACDSLTYAKAVVRKILISTRMLEHFPLAGRKVPEFDDENIRELLVHSYRIIYAVRERQGNGSGGHSRQENALERFPLQRQQRLLAFDAPSISADAAVLANDTMAGDRDRHRIGGTGTGHGANCARPADRLGDLTVRSRGPERNRLQVGPHAALEGCGANIEGQ